LRKKEEIVLKPLKGIKEEKGVFTCYCGKFNKKGI